MTSTITPRARWAVRLVAAAVPALVMAGVAAATIVSAQHPSAGDTVVAASYGYGASVQPQAEAPAAPHATAPSTTTSTLAAPASSVPIPTTAPPAPPRTPITDAPATTGVPSTTVAPWPSPSPTAAIVTLVNQYPAAVRLKINGNTYELAAGQEMTGVSVVPAPSGNDVIELTRIDVPTCGLGDAMGYFMAGGSYRLTVTVGLGACTPEGAKGPAFRVTPA